MLLVRTQIRQSTIHGLGLFAIEKIQKGAVIWVFNPDIDTIHTDEDLSKLASACREQIRKYAYFDTFFGAYVLCGDDSRFMNHSEDPSCLDPHPSLVTAARDIGIGEELTSDYSTFTCTTGLHLT